MKRNENLEVRSKKRDQDSSFSLPNSHFSPHPPTLVPKLRFPEFRETEGWPQSDLGRNATILKGKGISKADLDPNGSQSCIRYGELYTRYGETISEPVSRTNVPVSELFQKGLRSRKWRRVTRWFISTLINYKRSKSRSQPPPNNKKSPNA